MSFFKKIGNALGKVAKVALPVVGAFTSGSTLGWARGLNSISSAYGAYQQQQAELDNAEAAAQRNAAEAALQRQWASQEATTARNFNHEEAQNQMNFQWASSGRQMDFQERMANSAHQREVADLRAAGLNPILSGTGGMGSATPVGSSAAGASGHASAPSGAAASAPKASAYDLVAPVVASALSVAKTSAEVAKIQAEEAEVVARTPTHEIERERLKAATANLEADTSWKGVLKDRTVHEVEKTKWEAKRAFEEIYETYWSATYKEMLAHRTKAEVTTAEIESRTMKAIEDADLNELLKAYPMLAGLGNVLKPIFLRAMSK